MWLRKEPIAQRFKQCELSRLRWALERGGSSRPGGRWSIEDPSHLVWALRCNVPSVSGGVLERVGAELTAEVAICH